VEGNAGWEQADPHFHEDKFYVSMCHRESCKTVCGSKEIDQKSEGIVTSTRGGVFLLRYDRRVKSDRSASLVWKEGDL